MFIIQYEYQIDQYKIHTFNKEKKSITKLWIGERHILILFDKEIKLLYLKKGKIIQECLNNIIKNQFIIKNISIGDKHALILG